MSSTAPASRENTRPVVSPPAVAPDERPRFELIRGLRGQRRAGRGIFVVVLIGLLAVGLIAMLVINTSLAAGAFAINKLQRESAALAEQQQTLLQSVTSAAAPAELERRALALGMVPSSTPVFLRLADGSILGKPAPAKKPVASTLGGMAATGVTQGSLPPGTPAAEATASTSTGSQESADKSASVAAADSAAAAGETKANADTSNSTSGSTGDAAQPDGATVDGGQ